MPVELYHRDAGSGPAIVLLHAFPLSSAMWLAQRGSLGAGFRVITPDQRGFGGSPLGNDEPSLAHVADDLAALLDAKGIDGFVLGGLSMGGYVAMEFLRRHPGRVRALILADTRAGADAPAGRENRLRIAAAVTAAEDPGALLVEELLATLVGPTTVTERPLVYGRVKALVQSAPAAAVAWAQRAMADRPDSVETLRAASLPTLVLVGAEDTLTPVAEARAVAEAAGAPVPVEVPRAGHLSAVEAPEQFDAAVLEFLSRALSG